MIFFSWMIHPGDFNIEHVLWSMSIWKLPPEGSGRPQEIKNQPEILYDIDFKWII